MMLIKRALIRVGLLSAVAFSLGGCCWAPWGYEHGHGRDYGYSEPHNERHQSWGYQAPAQGRSDGWGRNGH